MCAEKGPKNVKIFHGFNRILKICGKPSTKVHFDDRGSEYEQQETSSSCPDNGDLATTNKELQL